jgi:L-alanine-DL-glutamate epimerase-like enolase superfamily enzyme
MTPPLSRRRSRLRGHPGMKMAVHIVDLPLRHTFTIALGSVSVQRNVVVELAEDGRRGYGEGAVGSAYTVTAETIAADLERVRHVVDGARLDTPEAFWERLRPHLNDNRFALCALDEAAHDLWGKRLGQPVWRLWGLDVGRCPPSCYTIGIDTVEKMVAKMQEYPGWPIYKIKLGTADDVRIMRELRRHTPARFRVDANTAWDVETTVRNAQALADLDVEFIEQPLPPADWEGMRRVYQRSALPLLADESCLVEEDVDRCVGHFHGINVKLCKAGGLTPARRMIARAKALGLTTMVGCMIESSVGISATAQLAPLLDYADLDGAVLLARDVARGVRVERGRIIFSPENGCGVQWLGGE